jgi:hypothetical protein
MFNSFAAMIGEAMKLDVPLTINGFACIINDGESICFGGADLECLDCEYKAPTGAVP